MSESNKDSILINIVGKIFTTKSFNIKYHAKICIVKQLILSRLKLNGNPISPTLEECRIITDSNILLDDYKTVKELCDEKLLYDGCNLSIDIKVFTGNNILSYNSLLDNKLEFGKTDIENDKVKSAVSHSYYSPPQSNTLLAISAQLTSALKYIKRKSSSRSSLSLKNKPSEDHALAWDDTPIDDSDWYN